MPYQVVVTVVDTETMQEGRPQVVGHWATLETADLPTAITLGQAVRRKGEAMVNKYEGVTIPKR